VLLNKISGAMDLGVLRVQHCLYDNSVCLRRRRLLEINGSDCKFRRSRQINL